VVTLATVPLASAQFTAQGTLLRVTKREPASTSGAAGERRRIKWALLARVTERGAGASADAAAGA
jgi:hypothetical protein